MYPTIFEYNGFVISSYGLMLMTAFLVCNYLLKKHLNSINVDGKIADDIIFYAAIGGILGSKIYYIIEEKQLQISNKFNDPVTAQLPDYNASTNTTNPLQINNKNYTKTNGK